jgi:hypothetical protein
MAAFLHRLSFAGQADPDCQGQMRLFTDVGAGAFCGPIEWLSGSGITTGYPDGTFRPRTAVSRQSMAAFLYRMAHPDSTASPCTVQQFWDVPISAPFCPEISWLASTGLSNGYQDPGQALPGFHPQAAVRRQTMAAFLYRADDTGVFQLGSGTPLPLVIRSDAGSGTTDGGDTVIVTGSGFTGATAVTFDSPSAVDPATGTDLTVISDSEIIVTTPPHATGTVVVRVTSPSGTSVPWIDSYYTYLDPNSFGTITGTITGGADGNGLSGVAVRAYDQNGTRLLTTHSRPDGTYSLAPLDAGGYFVCFDAALASGPSVNGYLDRCYDAASPDDPTQGTPVSVTLGSSTTDVDAVLAPGGAISGVITDAAGPVAAVHVYASEQGGGDFASTESGPDGTYALIGLETGTYTVCFDVSHSSGSSTSGYFDQCYDGAPISDPTAATPVSVIAGQSTPDIDATLAAAGAIAGTVTGATGPLANATVQVWSPDGLAQQKQTGIDGKYSATGLATGSYTICFSPSDDAGSADPGYVDQCYEDKPMVGPFDPYNATPISVTAGDIADIDVVLARGGAIAGTVSGATGPLSPVDIDVYDADGNYLLHGATSDLNGKYLVPNLAPGNYEVCFNVWDEEGLGYRSECYQDTPKDDPADATPVSVAAGRLTTGIDAVLAAID